MMHPPPPPFPGPVLLMGPQGPNPGLTQLPAGIGMEAQPGLILVPHQESSVPFHSSGWLTHAAQLQENHLATRETPK